MLNFEGRHKILFFISYLAVTSFFFRVSLSFAHSPHDVIRLLEISPNHDQDKTLFIIVLGYLLKSTDGGFSWKQLEKGLLNEDSLSSIAISPSYYLDKTVFLSGTEGDLYKTENGGESWYQITGNDIKATTIAFSPVQKKIIIGDDRGVLYVSTDGGKQWQKLYEIPNAGSVTSIAFSPNFSSDSTFFVGTEKGGAFKTVDSGSTLVEVNNGISDKFITSVATSPEYGADSVVFVSTWYDGVFRSDDGGKTWKRYSTGLTSNPQADTFRFKSPHFRDLRISKTFREDGTVFLGGFDGLFKSTDGGHIWIQMETLAAKRITGLALSNGYKDNSTTIVAIATFDGGVYITMDQGITWDILNRGLNHTHLMDIAFSTNFSSNNTIFTDSIHAFYKSNYRGENWDRIELGYKGWRRRIGSLFYRIGLSTNLLLTESEEQPLFPSVIAVSPDYVSDNTIYFGTRYQGVFKTEDGGLNWSSILRTNRWINSLAISPDFAFDKTLYVGVLGERIYKTVDGGVTWQSAYKSHHRYPISLAVSPYYKTDKTVFAGTAEGLVKTVDGGTTWEKVGGHGENNNIKTIALSPNYKNDGTVIISVYAIGLFKSNDGGLSFVEIGKDLIDNNYSLRQIEFSPKYSIDNTTYGASEEELFQSLDSGNTWKLIKRPIRYENTKDYIYYDGKWGVLTDDDFSTMSISYSDVAKSRVTFNFVGRGINLIGTKSDNQGIASLYIDGDFKGYVDQFDDKREVMVDSYAVRDLSYGPHSIMLEVTGTKNSRSKGYRIEIDAFDVVP